MIHIELGFVVVGYIKCCTLLAYALFC